MLQPEPSGRTRIIVNGEPTETDVRTLAGLVAAFGFDEASVATALNGEFVARRARLTTRLAPGDEVEIVAPRQGG